MSGYVRLLIFTALNSLMIIGFYLGFGTIHEILISAYHSGLTSFNEAQALLIEGTEYVLALETYYLTGTAFCLGVITYDIVLLYSWITSFSLTNVKSCKRCHHKIIRERRTPFDRFASWFVALKRYRCVGCSKEYLMITRLAKKEPVLRKDQTAAQKVYSDK